MATQASSRYGTVMVSVDWLRIETAFVGSSRWFKHQSDVHRRIPCRLHFHSANGRACCLNCAVQGDGKDRRVLLDNIDWEAVVPHVPTRNRTQCVAKWYLRLAPSMADRGLWGQGDDKKLMKSLWNLLQNSTEGFPAWHEATVPWGELVEGRTGDECRRRWALLKKHVSNAKNKEFEGMVVELVRRYFPSWVSRPATATGHRASMSREP